MKKFFKYKYIIIFIILIIIYVSTYYILSRKAIELSNTFGTEGYYFTKPQPDSDDWKIFHYTLLYFYWPLTYLEKIFGTLEKYPALHEPQWGLQKKDK